MANRSISLCRCVNIAYYMDDCFFSKSGGEGKRKEKKRKEKRRKEKEFESRSLGIRTCRVEKMIRASISPIET